MSCCQKMSGDHCPQSSASPLSPPLQKKNQPEGSETVRVWEGDEAVWRAVQQYYGERMKRKEDVETGVNRCEMQTAQVPEHLRLVLGEIHSEITNTYYGCGLVIPEALEGCSVLDLGCGTGRDCYAVSKLVGAEGRVVGVDMTEQQLAVARQYMDYHRNKFGFNQPNVDFLFGYIEKLSEAGLKDNTFDIEISNGVLNLCPDKGAVLKEAFRVLKKGGELYFCDVYTDTHLTPDIRHNRELWGQCVAGALHWEDLYNLSEQIGFSHPRLVSAIAVNTSKFSHILGEARFVSATYRLFKVPPTPQSPCVVTYMGGIQGSADCLTLDCHTSFQKGQSLAVDGEVAAILCSSRFQPFFSFDQEGYVTPVTTNPKVDPFQMAVESNLCCS